MIITVKNNMWLSFLLNGNYNTEGRQTFIYIVTIHVKVIISKGIVTRDQEMSKLINISFLFILYHLLIS